MSNSDYSLGNTNSAFFSLNLKRRRLELGISKEELSNQLNITISELDKLEEINNIFIAPNAEIVNKINLIFKNIAKQSNRQIIDTIISRVKNPQFLINNKETLQTDWKNNHLLIQVTY